MIIYERKFLITLSSCDILKLGGEPMIYVFALNPSIDYHMEVNDITFGETNRSTKESYVIGGKGVNVALVLEALGTQSTILGFEAGFTGQYIKDELSQHRLIQEHLIHTNGNSRINVKLKQVAETEINASGPLVPNDHINKLEMYRDKLTKDDVVVLNGSLAKGMDEDWYLHEAKKLSEQGIPFILDIATPKMIDICQYRPLLVKPNQDELEMIFETEIKGESELIHFAQKLIMYGAQHVLLSLGAKGSMLIVEDTIYQASNPEGKVLGTVGAGDSMIAGFLYEFTQGRGLETAYRTAVAAGSGTAYSMYLTDKAMVEKLRKEIIINKTGRKI